MSDKYKRIQGGNSDFKSAETCFRPVFQIKRMLISPLKRL